MATQNTFKIKPHSKPMFLSWVATGQYKEDARWVWLNKGQLKFNLCTPHCSLHIVQVTLMVAFSCDRLSIETKVSMAHWQNHNTSKCCQVLSQGTAFLFSRGNRKSICLNILFGPFCLKLLVNKEVWSRSIL